MENEQSGFRVGITNQIQQAAVHCEPPQANRTWDSETQVYSRSPSKGQYIDFVGQVFIRLNVVGNGNRAIIGGPKEPSFSDASNKNAKEDTPLKTEASRDTKGEGKEMIKYSRKTGQIQRGADDVMECIHRLIREDKEKQIQVNKDCFKGDLGNADFAVRKRVIDESMDECMAKVKDCPSYLCDQRSHQIYKVPVVTPSGFACERRDIEDDLKNVGKFDPFTRVKLTADLLIPNHAMKNLVDACMSDKSASSTQSGCKSWKRLRGSKPY